MALCVFMCVSVWVGMCVYVCVWVCEVWGMCSVRCRVYISLGVGFELYVDKKNLL